MHAMCCRASPLPVDDGLVSVSQSGARPDRHRDPAWDERRETVGYMCEYVCALVSTYISNPPPSLSPPCRCSMDPAVSKMLFLHLPTRHPTNFPELEISPLVQSAALFGVGLLYQGSSHR